MEGIFMKRMAKSQLSAVAARQAIRSQRQRKIVTLRNNPNVRLEYLGESYALLWFDPNLVHEMILIHVKKICRNIKTDTNARITADSHGFREGLIALRCNPSVPVTNGNHTIRSVAEQIAEVLKSIEDHTDLKRFYDENGSSR